MAHMSYCRFENTLRDLKDCYEALMEAGTVEDYIREKVPNHYEKRAIENIIELCSLIVEEFGNE